MSFLHSQLSYEFIFGCGYWNGASCPGWGPDPNFCLIRLSRPKLSLIRLYRRRLTLIRLSTPKLPLIRLSRHKGSLTRLFRPKVFWSEHLQTMVQTQIQTIAQTLIRLMNQTYDHIQVRSTRLWSDPVASRSIYGQTQLLLQPFMIRLKRARNRFWSDSTALEIVWSEKSFTYQKNLIVFL